MLRRGFVVALVLAFILPFSAGWWPFPPMPHCAVQSTPMWYDWICHPYHGSDAPPKPPNPGTGR